VLACRLIPTSCKLVRNLCSSSIVMQGVFITVSIASCILSLTRGSLCLHLLSQAVNQGDAYLLLSSNAFSHSSNTFSHSSNTFSHTFVHTCSVRRSIKAMHTRFFLATSNTFLKTLTILNVEETNSIQIPTSKVMAPASMFSRANAHSHSRIAFALSCAAHTLRLNTHCSVLRTPSDCIRTVLCFSHPQIAYALFCAAHTLGLHTHCPVLLTLSDCIRTVLCCSHSRIAYALSCAAHTF
jgi:hypothetical protein